MATAIAPKTNTHAWVGDRERVPQGLLEPTPASWSARIGARLGRVHPVLAVLTVLLGSFAGLAVMMIGSGAAMTHVVAHSRIGHWDDRATAWFVARRGSPWNSFSAVLTRLGDTAGVAAVAAVTTIVLLVRRWGRNAMLLFLGLAVELAVFLSTTYVVARPRPHLPRLGSTPSTYSWPSGHTAATVVLYGGIALLVAAATRRPVPRILTWGLAWLLAIGVALSRIYRGEHHPTDTLAGLVLGIGALATALFAIRTWGASSTKAHAGRMASRQ